MVDVSTSQICKVCSDPNCMVVSMGCGYHCKNKRGNPPATCFAFKEKKKEKCSLCEADGYYSEDGSDVEPTIQFSQRTPVRTQRYEPATPVSKRKRNSVSAVASVVSNNINSYWDHLKQAKEALENDIITQEDYDDLKAHFLKKLKEM